MSDIKLNFFPYFVFFSKFFHRYRSMGVFGAAAFIVGTSLGAGFLSGAELVRFFGAERFLPSVILSSAVFFLLCTLFLCLGKKHGGYDGALSIFGRGKGAVKLVLSALSFVPCAGMLAGLDAILPKLSPLSSLLGLLLVLLFLGKGMKGIGALNSVLVPVLLFFVFYSAKDGLVFSYPALSGKIWLGIVYAGMNIFLGVPVLLDAGRNIKKPVLSAALAALAIAACAVCVLGVVYREGAGAIFAELPFLYAMRGSKIFHIASALAILTSLASAVYPLLRLCDGIKSVKKKNAARGGLLLAAFALSRLGLSGIVKFFYPAMGVLGITFSAVCIFYEYLFEKHDQKVHCRGKHAKNDGRAHDEVKLKHLTAVHDEIPKSGARNEVFAHDRADPRHAHRNF